MVQYYCSLPHDPEGTCSNEEPVRNLSRVAVVILAIGYLPSLHVRRTPDTKSL
ncbi:hypothetical protein PISMIDRAFT_679525, partial [Pisolithus microcarpus 441]